MTDSIDWDKKLEELDSPEDMAGHYNVKLSAVMDAVEAYNGTVDAEERLFDRGGELESWIVETFGLEEGMAPPVELEEALGSAFGGQEGASMTIEGSLDKAIDYFESLLANQMVDLEVLKVPLSGVILPPKPRNGEGGGRESASCRRSLSKSSKLIMLLLRNGIYVDDLVVMEGDIPVGAHRKVGYRLFEIPRLNRQILVCDEIGEITFVVLGTFSRDSFVLNSKDEFKDAHRGDKVVWFNYDSDRQWMDTMQEWLFKDNEPGVKVDVQARERVLVDLRQQMPTSGDWVKKCNSEGIRSVVSYGMKICSIATAIGFDGYPHDKADFLKMAQLIYGADDELLKSAILCHAEDHAELIRLFKVQFPDVKAWLALTTNQVRARRFGPKGVEVSAPYLGKVLGVGRLGEAENNMRFIELIYGDDPDVKAERAFFEEEKRLAANSDAVKALIYSEYPTPQDWLGISAFSAVSRKIGGHTFWKIGVWLGQGTDGNKEWLLRLGTVAYEGVKGVEEIQAALDLHVRQRKRAQELQTAEALIPVLRQQVGSAKAWSAMAAKKDIPAFHVEGTDMAMKVVLTVLGVSGRVGRLNHLKAGVLIFPGEEGRVLQDEIDQIEADNVLAAEFARDPVKWRAVILEKYPSPADWIAVGFHERREMKFSGRRIGWIGTKAFDVRSSAVTRTAFLRLGLEIYKDDPDSVMIQEELDRRAKN
jgi:hypothetical protein